MNIILYLNIKKTDTCYNQAMNEYIKRMSGFAKVGIKLFKSVKELKPNKSSYKFPVRFGQNSLSSNELAKKITDINLSGCSCIEFFLSDDNDIINDIYKLICENDNSENCEFFEITSMKLRTDALATALTEQIYRAYTINNHISYHK